MSKGVFETIGGIALTVAGAALAIGGSLVVPGGAALLGKVLINAGIGLTLSGIGTLLSGDPVRGFATVLRDPVAPWNVFYGYGRVGGTCIYVNPFGTDSSFLDLVFVLTCHSTYEFVPTLLFNKKLIQIGDFNYSFTPAQQNVIIDSIVRINNVVQVTLHDDIPLLQDGYQVTIQQLPYTHTTDAQYSAMGLWQVSGVIHAGGKVSFYYLSGGGAFNIVNAGHCLTAWANVGSTVYMEALHGNQVLGQTFLGMTLGTYNGSASFISPEFYNLGNPWISTCSAPGKTIVMLRLGYNGSYYQNGIPQISFLVRGKNDIYDPRLGNATGIGTLNLDGTGGSGYKLGDILTIGNAVIAVGFVSPTGAIQSFTVTGPGSGHSIAAGLSATTITGTGSGAQFAIIHLTGDYSSGLCSVSVSGGNYEFTSTSGTGFSPLNVGGVCYLMTSIGNQPFLVNSYIDSTHILCGSLLNGGWLINFNGLSNVGYSISLCNQYTQNSALCIADYLSNFSYGFKVPYLSGIDQTQLIAAANICDEQVQLAWPPVSPLLTESRYTCNGGFTLDHPRSEILQNLLTSITGRLTYIEGIFFIWPGTWLGTAGTISGNQIYDLLISPPVWRPKVPINNLYNSVKGTYISPANNWQAADFPPYQQDIYHGYNNGSSEYAYDANLTADKGDRRYLDVQFPFTTSSATVQRLAKIELLRRRFQGTGTFTFSMWAYQWVPIDVLAVDLSYFGWSGQLLEIAAMRLRIETQGSGSGAILVVDVDIQETDDSIYAWDIGEELSAQGYQQAIVPNNLTPPQPTDFFGFSENGAIFLTWDAPADGFVLNGGHIEVRYQLVESPEGLWISLGRMDPSITTAIIPNLTIGASYNVEIQAVNVVGVPSPWLTVALSGTSPVVEGPILILAPNLWDPEFETPIPGDPLYGASPVTLGFGIDQSYPLSANGNSLAQLDIYGNSPPTGLGLTFRVRRELVSGIWAQQSASISGSSPISGEGEISFGGSEGSPGSQVGRILSKLANDIDDSDMGDWIPLADFVILANDGNGNFTVSPDPTSTNPATGNPFCKAGDFFTLRTGGPASPGVANPLTADLTSFTDPLFTNGYNSQGLIKHGNAGNLVFVIGGTGVGQPPVTVIDNNGPSDSPANKVFVTPWQTIPDSTSILVMVEANPQVTTPSNTTQDNNSKLVGSVVVQNYRLQVVRCEAYTTDSLGLEGPPEHVPFREVYLWGAQGTRTTFSTSSMMVTDGFVRHATSSGNQDFTLLADTEAPNVLLTLRKVTSDVNTVTVKVKPASGNTFAGGGTTLTLRAGQFTQLLFPGDGSGVIVPIAGVGTGSGSGSVPNLSFAFVSQTTVTITGVSHGLGTASLTNCIYDNSNPALEIFPSTFTVDPISFDVVVTFENPTSGTIVLNASGGNTISSGIAVPITVNATSNISLAPVSQNVNGDATGGTFTETIPLAASWVGLVMTLIKTDATTNAIDVALSGSDTIEGISSFSLTTQWQTATITSTGTGKLIFLNLYIPNPSAVGALAPNVTASGITVTYGQFGNASTFSLSGTINLPTTDPAYSHLKQIILTATGPGANQSSIVGTLSSSSFSGTTITFVGSAILQDPSPESWDLTFTVYNEAGTPTPSPYVATGISVNASAVTVVTGAVAGGSRYIDKATRQTHEILNVFVTLAGGQYPQISTIFVNQNDSNGWRQYNWYTIVSGATAIPLDIIPPLVTNPSWLVAAIAGAFQGTTAYFPTLPTGAVSSSPISVAGLGLPQATDITALTIPSGAGGSWPYNSLEPDGSQYWNIPPVSFDDSGCLTDVEATFVVITVQDLDSSHNPVLTAGPNGNGEHEFASFLVSQSGMTQTTTDLGGDYGLNGGAFVRSADIAYVRFRIYVGTRVNQTNASFADATATTLQNSWTPGALISGGPDYGADIEVAAAGALPPGMIQGGRIDPSSLGPGMEISSSLLQAAIDTAVMAFNGSNQVTVKAAGITATQLAANSVTAANGALAANSVVDSNVVSMGIVKLTYGTTIFAGPVYLSQGSANPVVGLLNTGIFLYSTAASGGGSGLTSAPYVAIQSSGIGIFSGTNPSVTIDSSSVTLWSVNGNTGDPYLSLTSSSITIINGSFTSTFSAAAIKFAYSTTIYTQVSSAGVTIINGSYSVTMTSSLIQLSDGGSNTLSLSASSGIVLSNGSSSVTINSSSVAIANGSFSCTGGIVTVNIDKTNFIKISDTGGLHAQLSEVSLIVFNTPFTMSVTANEIVSSTSASSNISTFAPNNLEMSDGTNFVILEATGFSSIGTSSGFSGTVLTSGGTKNVLGGIIQA